ncbi:SPG1 (YGR236C) [Zygosaccharomyces parabailii]|nr:SPG1 (YGR236C) [Zygosaccharomyces parabailii]CDH09960.1 uncharacterized protein ZBAI_01744 [Zygosaccharomyces bailii ISA1307]
MRLGPKISAEVQHASRLPSMRYWMVAFMCGAVVPAIYLRGYSPMRGATIGDGSAANSSAAGQQATGRASSRDRKTISPWSVLSRSYNKVPEDEAGIIMFSSIL